MSIWVNIIKKHHPNMVVPCCNIKDDNRILTLMNEYTYRTTCDYPQEIRDRIKPLKSGMIECISDHLNSLYIAAGLAHKPTTDWYSKKVMDLYYVDTPDIKNSSELLVKAVNENLSMIITKIKTNDIPCRDYSLFWPVCTGDDDTIVKFLYSNQETKLKTFNMNSPLFHFQYGDIKLNIDKEREWYVVMFTTKPLLRPENFIFQNYMVSTWGSIILAERTDFYQQEEFKKYEDSLPVVKIINEDPHVTTDEK